MAEYRIDRIGYVACQALSDGGSGQVIGVTSRGVFLLTNGEQVVYVTDEPEISPLTISLVTDGINWHDLHIRDSMRIDNNTLQIGLSLSISLEGLTAWFPPLPGPIPILPGTSIRERLDQVVRQLIFLKGDVGWAACLSHLVGQPFETELFETRKIDLLIHQLRLAMFSERLDQVISAVKPFLGSGRGLTPSGDDFIIGMLLGLTRWPSIVKFHPSIPILIERIVLESTHSTTRISRAMIASAAGGAADERVLIALEGILTGNRPVNDCAEMLADYGGSSGIDSLTGFAALLVI